MPNFVALDGNPYPVARLASVRDDVAVWYLTPAELEAGLDHIRSSPPDDGELRLIVARPELRQREVMAEAVLSLATGLVGDNWLARGSRHTSDGAADLDRQITVMNSRVAELVAGGPDRAPLAGDQLYVDLDISVDNLPAGTLLRLGDAVLEISDAPHLGCAKFVDRFGPDTMRFVNSRTGRALRLRGLNARVVVPGTIRVGDPATKDGATGAAPSSGAQPSAARSSEGQASAAPAATR